MSDYFYQGIHFHYEVEGEGPPLLFLHGLGGDWTQGQTILEHVHGFEKIFMDVRGHGTTNPLGPPENLNFDQLAEDAFSLVQHLGCKELIVGGLSMGAAIALKMAFRVPQYVKALMIIRPAWLNEPNPKNLKAVVALGKLLRNYDLEKAKSIFLESQDYRELMETAPASANSLIGQFDAPHAKEYAARLINIPASTPYDHEKDLERIQVKTLIISTDRDPVHPLWMAETLATRLSASHHHRVTSKSEDVDRHYDEISSHINTFMDEYRGMIDPRGWSHHRTGP
jgi:pimeloyl-ACP methyl ester carboxylesterase